MGESVPAALKAFQIHFQQAGLRMTDQRAAVLRVLAESEAHLDAEGIWLRAKDYDPSINLATVYRTLALLKEMGLIDPRTLAPDRRRQFFEPANKPDHYHFTCLGCGRVEEFQSDLLDRGRTQIAIQHGWRITSARISFEGYCERCNATSSEEGPS